MSQQATIAETLSPQDIIQVGRQPILDRKQQTYGYELLYRSADTEFTADMDGNRATANTMLNVFMEFGLRELVGTHKAFFNLTRTFFTELKPLPLDKSRLVLEILENIEVDDALIQGVRRLHKNGYCLALDDYRFEPHWEPVLPYIDIIKVDLPGLKLENHTRQIRELKQRGLTLLAEKVETIDEFKLTMELGFDLFQGYFFAKPQTFSNRRLDANQALMLQMLARINDPDCSIEELAKLISHDPKLSYKILHFINSAAIGLPSKVKSIQHAVTFVGLNRLRAWATLFVMAGMGVAAPEIVTTGLVRAELCQSLSKALSSGEPNSAYTVGLLSVLDAMLGKPMDQLAGDLPLPEMMLDALTVHSGPYGKELNCALALEQYQWQKLAVKQTLPVAELTSLYVDALSRAAAIQVALH